MRHTLKWSFFIGVTMAGAVLALLKLFQPIRYEHLVLFGYAFVGSSVIAGYTVHRNFEKWQGKPAGAMGERKMQDMGNLESAIKRVPVEKADPAGAEESAIRLGFVPASALLDSGEVPEKMAPTIEAAANISDDASLENKEPDRQYGAAEKFLSEIEIEEAENEIHEPEGNDENIFEKPIGGVFRHENLLKFAGRQAKVILKDGKTICGRFAGMDSHVVLEDAACASERKSLLMVSKSEIARMEVE